MSIAAKLCNRIFALMSAPLSVENGRYLAERKRNRIFAAWPMPRNLKREACELEGIKAEKISKPGNDKGLLFFIHGGGFTTGDYKERRIFTYYVSDHYGYDSLAFNYALAPENKWPSQLEDCFKAYESILKQGYDPEDIVVTGESAGGCLALSLLLLLKERKVPQPKAVLVFSPVTNNYDRLPSHINNIRTDYMLKDVISKGLADALFEKDQDFEKRRDHLISPYYGNYEGLPPVFISASDSETLYDDALSLYEKLKDEDHKVMIDIAHGLCHSYPMLTFLPEARKTLDKAFAFLDEL